MTASPLAATTAPCTERAQAVRKDNLGSLTTRTNQQPGGHHSGRIAPKETKGPMDNQTFPVGGRSVMRASYRLPRLLRHSA